MQLRLDWYVPTTHKRAGKVRPRPPWLDLAGRFVFRIKLGVSQAMEFGLGANGLRVLVSARVEATEGEMLTGAQQLSPGALLSVLLEWRQPQ